MEQYLKLFKTSADYDAASEKPLVSHIVEDVDVIMKGHDYVEIGGIKWATMNIGANNITDIGLYFQWGDTKGYTSGQCGSGDDKKYFYWPDYKYSNGGSSSSDMTKYNNSDGKKILDAEDDAVTAAWGGNWRMPTKDEFVTLGNSVNTEVIINYQGSGVNGRLMTDKNDSSKVLFFPNGGYCSEGLLKYADDANTMGCYWAKTLAYWAQFGHCYFSNGKSHVSWNSDYERCRGYLIRGVLDE